MVPVSLKMIPYLTRSWQTCEIIETNDLGNGLEEVTLGLREGIGDHRIQFIKLEVVETNQAKE